MNRAFTIWTQFAFQLLKYDVLLGTFRIETQAAEKVALCGIYSQWIHFYLPLAWSGSLVSAYEITRHDGPWHQDDERKPL